MSAGWEETVTLCEGVSAVVAARRGEARLRLLDMDVAFSASRVEAFADVLVCVDHPDGQFIRCTFFSGAGARDIVAPASRFDALIATMRAASRFSEGR